jgi:hypothetical protein
MGQPAEVFMYGPQLWLFGAAAFAAIPLTGYVLIPLYHELKLTSAFEYLGRRFNRYLQLFASTLFSLQMVDEPRRFLKHEKSITTKTCNVAGALPGACALRAGHGSSPR